MEADRTTGVKILLVVEYQGTNYHGSQFQKNAPTIQGEIEKALKKLTGKKIRIKLASRTDAGVHACGQVAAFNTDSAMPVKSFADGLNHFLPRDIAVRKARRVDDSLDVRRGAISREYRYCILNAPTRSPLLDNFSYRVSGSLDIEAMKEACRALPGEHDFASFVSSAETARTKRTVRDIFKVEIKQHGDMIFLDIVANSFLPHQVRNTVGSLIKVGQGRMTAEDFADMISAKTPGLAGPTAPAAGLCLIRVNYPDAFEGDTA